MLSYMTYAYGITGQYPVNNCQNDYCKKFIVFITKRTCPLFTEKGNFKL